MNSEKWNSLDFYSRLKIVKKQKWSEWSSKQIALISWENQTQYVKNAINRTGKF